MLNGQELSVGFQGLSSAMGFLLQDSSYCNFAGIFGEAELAIGDGQLS